MKCYGHFYFLAKNQPFSVERNVLYYVEWFICILVSFFVNVSFPDFHYTIPLMKAIFGASVFGGVTRQGLLSKRIVFSSFWEDTRHLTGGNDRFMENTNS